MRHSWGGEANELITWATSADSRKHTDSLESERHYLDVDDVNAKLVQIWGLPWTDAHRQLLGEDSVANPRRFGVLPWELERAYRRLVRAMAPRDSSCPDLEYVRRAAADLGHYLADAHVPLHTSGNYDGQRTGQRGIHALWETQAVEWMLLRQHRTCPCSDPDSWFYDPVWTPWEVIQESHSLASGVFEAHRQWDSLGQQDGFGFQRRGRTLHLSPTPESLARWDSLTGGTTWPRYCRAAERIAASWHSAWEDAGRPELSPPPSPSVWQKLSSYLPHR